MTRPIWSELVFDVAPAQPADDAVGMRIVRADEDVQEPLVVDDARRRRERGLASLGRLHLPEVLDSESRRARPASSSRPSSTGDCVTRVARVMFDAGVARRAAECRSPVACAVPSVAKPDTRRRTTAVDAYSKKSELRLLAACPPAPSASLFGIKRKYRLQQDVGAIHDVLRLREFLR